MVQGSDGLMNSDKNGRQRARDQSTSHNEELEMMKTSWVGLFKYFSLCNSYDLLTSSIEKKHWFANEKIQTFQIFCINGSGMKW